MQAPLASDLRFIASVLAIITDLEHVLGTADLLKASLTKNRKAVRQQLRLTTVVRRDQRGRRAGRQQFAEGLLQATFRKPAARLRS